MHGLGGRAESGYILGLLRTLAATSFQGVAIEYRGAGGQPNAHRRFYHAGEWQDPQAVAEHLRRTRPAAPLYAVGFSLGASILLNWLIATGERCPVDAAVAVSTPFDLAACARRIGQRSIWIYRTDMLKSLHQLVREKFRQRTDAPWPLARLHELNTLRRFDDCVTAPLHGFANAADYY